jgi:hypothetical protein
MDTHHHDSHAAGEASAVAGWMGALVFLIVAAILLIALFAWAPWDDNNTNTTPDTGTEEGTDINVDVNPSGQPQASP